MKDVVFIKTNKCWQVEHKPMASVITTVHNRREVLLRAMRSVDAQSFRDLEYIVVDNGSTINIDDVVEGFMSEASIPVKYIKRTSGIGPHTGKNSAIQAARGRYLVMLDSDDELLPNAVEVLYGAWNRIPDDIRSQYREVVALCEDEYGHRLGDEFPENLNHCSKQEAYRIWHNSEGLSVEHVNMSVTKHLQDYPFPEPEGVTWVVDSTVLWDRLSKLYKSYFINDRLKRYYTGSADSISNTQINKITTQHCINMLFSDKFTLEHIAEYDLGFWGRIKKTMHYCVFMNILKGKSELPNYEWVRQPIKGLGNTILITLLWLPSILGANIYVKKKM